MKTTKLAAVPNAVTPENLHKVMDQAIGLELATIPTYLATYYSIKRTQNQDALFQKLQLQLTKSAQGMSPAEVNELAQELKVDILTYSNKTAALVMSVVIEEMLHMALACNVKTSVCQEYPNLMEIGKGFHFPAELDGHKPEFMINGAKLSLEQLTTFLQIESPQPFVDPEKAPAQKHAVVDYKTIGRLYAMIKDCINNNVEFKGPYAPRPQLLPPEPNKPQRPFYNQNSMNTMYFDRDHNPKFVSEEDSGELVGVYNAATASQAIDEIVEQGEGQSKDQQHILVWGNDQMPVPLNIIDGEAQFWPGDYDDDGKELAHFAKFLEAYTFGKHYKEKFNNIPGLDDFYSYFVHDQLSNASQDDYVASGNNKLALANQLGNALFSYLLLMIETCYYKDESTQYDLFMYGIHKSMIWLLSGVGNQINAYSFKKNGTTYQGSLTWETYEFATDSRPKAQILAFAADLAKADPDNWGWAINEADDNYFPALPDVGLDHSVIENVPAT